MKLYFYVLIFVIVSCNHPESSSFSRDKKDVQQNPSSQVEKSISQKEGNILEMEVENGVRYIWIEINGIRLRFIFDTGASSICISPAEASVLYRQGTLTKDDILDKEFFKDATGKISEGTKINLREVKIGNMVLDNVKATIVDNVDAPLLLGQTVLERFGKIEIDNYNYKIIFN